MDEAREGPRGSITDEGRGKDEDVAAGTPASAPDDQYRAMFEASPTPLIVVTPPDWTIVAANDARLQVTGSTREELIGRKLFELYPDNPCDPDASGVRNLSASFERVMATKAPDIMAVQRYPVEGPTGHFVERWWSPVNSPVFDAEGEVTRIIHRAEEVTGIVRMRGEAEAADQLARDQQAMIERLRATEAALRRDQGRLGAAVAISRLGTFDWDLGNGRVELDDRAREIFGFGAHEGNTEQEVFARVHPADLPHVQEAALRSRELRQRLEIEYRLRLPDGTLRIVRSISEAVSDTGDRTRRMVGVFDDVTARHADQQRLRESEERSRRIIEGVRDYAVFTTDHDGLVVDWTPGAETLFGWPQSEIVGLDCAVLFTPEDQVAGTPALELQTARNDGCANDERWHMRRDGSRFFANGSVRPLHGPGGKIAGFIKIARDETARRAVDDRLRASEELNRRVLASSADCFKVLDLDARVEFMSEGGMRVMEVDDFADLEGRNWLDLWSGDERAKAESAVAAARNGAVGRFQGFAATLKGKPRWWDVIVTPITGPSGEPEKLLSVSRDVTGARMAEEQLRESEARYRALFTSLDVGFCVIELWFDDEGRAADYRFVEVNPAFEHQTGLADAAGRWMRDLAPFHEQYWFDLYGQVALTGEPARFENPASELGDRWFDVHAFRTGHPDERRVAILFNDITPRRRAEESLQRLNETLEAQVAERTADRDRLWRNSQDLLLIARFDATIMAVNPAWTRVLGWEEHELIGTNFLTLIHPDDVAASTAEAASLSGQGRSVMQFVNRYRGKDGGWRWLSWAVTSHDGLFHGVARDVTAEKESQDELSAAQEALRQAQKMEAMGQLTGGVAHDFNNLLTPIVGSLDMLQRNGLGSEREQRLIAGAAQSADRAKVLVQRLLAFARRQPLQPIAVDVGKLVKDMGDLIGSTTGPQVRVVVDAPEETTVAKADPNQLEMALLNLAVNARDAMPEGGTLRISATPAAVKGSSPSGVQPGDYIRVSVADTGHGMDEATLARAVEPFFSTKGIGKGTGLGLSMVHGLASQLGGALTVQSRVGLGTNVELWLPQTTLPAEVQQRPEVDTSKLARGRALLVDDEELVRLSTADMLSDLGYAVVEAATGEEALRLIRRGEQFDLLVTDHLMPGMTGADLAREVRASRPTMPVLIASGYAEGEGIGPDLPRLAKPFRKDELALSLAHLASTP